MKLLNVGLSCCFVLLRISVLFAISALSFADDDITAYTLSTIPVSIPADRVYSVRIIYFDKVSKLTKKLSAGLPSDQAQAAQILRARIESQDGQQIQFQIRESFEDLLEANSLGIDRLPAWVFRVDGASHIVYGARSLDEANSTRNDWLSKCNDGGVACDRQ